MSPAPKKAKAAAAEQDGGSHTVQWRGTEFTVPAVLPADLAWAMADLESSSRSFAPILGVLRSVLGEEQEQALRAKLAADEVSFADLPDALSELLSAVFETFGMAEGDSSASAPS